MIIDQIIGGFKMSWSEETIQSVWEKGEIIPGNDENRWRKDQCGAWIGRIEYGNRNSQYGWEIDHINPNGSDNLSNLRPLQWKNNTDKSDGRLKCNVTSSGKDNIDRS
jgi:hypothetical protein